jgi:DNA-binding transcriptional LysR family regulator
MNMDVAVLRWFQQVADGVTVTEVGEIHRVSQSGVSRALDRLESEAGTALLRRSGRSLRMTRAGAVFKRHVDALLHELDDGLAAVSQLIDPETGTVTIAVQPSLSTWLLPELIAAFRENHPDIRFDLRHVRDRVAPSVELESADLMLATTGSADPEVEWRQLFVEPLNLVVPAGHPLAVREDLQLADAASEPFVVLRSRWSLRQVTETLCAQAGFQPRVAFEADDLSTVRGLVSAGLGVTIMPAAHEDAANGAGVRSVRIADPAAARGVGLAWSKNGPLLPSAALFREHVLGRAYPAAHGPPG